MSERHRTELCELHQSNEQLGRNVEDSSSRLGELQREVKEKRTRVAVLEKQNEAILKDKEALEVKVLELARRLEHWERWAKEAPFSRQV